MITYSYQAVDAQGKTVTGVAEALNEENAINTLMGRGLMVLSIQEKGVKRSLLTVGKVSDTDLVMATRQLATMVEAGLPLLSALSGIYEQADPKRQAGLKFVTGEVMARVQQGETFNESISKHPRVFSRLYISMVRAGEAAGMLAEILDRLAGFLEASSRLKKKVKSAMTYPAIVITIAFAITLFLVVVVVPKFADIFKDFGSKLPAPTQFLIDTSDLLRSFWFIFLALGVGAFFGIRSFLRTKSGQEIWSRYQLKLPIFGPLIHKICMSRLARTFAQLIRSGVPILEVMEIISETSGNVVVERSIRSVATDVEKGDSLANALSRQPIFPPIMLRMVAAGESTGKVDAMLEKLADFWDEEIEATLNSLTSLIEPFLIVFLGIVVGGIVTAMFLPIFKMSDLVSGGG